MARCLILVYLENFAQHDFEKFYSNSENTGCIEDDIESCDNESKLAYLSFDLFNWLDRNLKQSNKYQDRQIYIDIISILIKFLFHDSFGCNQSSPNHFIVDLHDLCSSLIDTKYLTYRFSKKFPSLKDLHSSQFFMMLIIQRYRLLHLFTELSTKDRVNTIRASACTVLYSLLQCINFWVVNNIHCLTEIEERPDDNCIEAIMDYYDCYIENIEDNSSNTCYNGFNSDHLYRRLQTETDRIVIEELNKVFQLVDDYRLDFNLNYYQLKNKRKKQRKRENSFLLPEVTPEIIIDSNVIELVDELLLFVENMNIDIDIFADENCNIDDININEVGIDIEDAEIKEQINIDDLEEPHILSLPPPPSSQQFDNNRRGLIFIPNVELEQSNSNIHSENSDTITKQSSITTNTTNTTVINQESSSATTPLSPLSSPNKSPMKRKSSKHTNSNSHVYSSNQFSKTSNSSNTGNSSKSLASKLSNKNKNLHHKHWSINDVTNSSNTSHYRSNQQSVTGNLKTKTKHKESQQSIHISNSSNKAVNAHHSTNLVTPGSGTMKSNSQRNVALLPTPVFPGTSNRHHHQYRNSKVPVYSNHTSNNLTGSVNYLPAPTTSGNSSGPVAPTPYSGMCFRIVYPSLLSSAQFYTTPGVNPVLTSQPQQSNYTTHSGPQLMHPNHSQQHYHHHAQHIAGTNFSTQSKLPKTTTSSFYRAQIPNITTSSTTNLPLPSKFKQNVPFNHSKFNLICINKN